MDKLCRDKYLEKLGMGVEIPSLLYLNELIVNHLRTFSFNNLKVFFGDRAELPLEIDYLLNTVILEEKGGYCFELNKVFFYLLKELGFQVEAKLARVNYNRAGDFPRTHRVTIVEIDGRKYLADVGFGPYSPNQAVSLSGVDVDCYGRAFRIELHPNYRQLEVFREGSFFELYQFDNGRYEESDFSIANYYTSTHPDSKFVNELVISRIDGGTLEFISNSTYSKVENEIREDIALDSQSVFRDILERFNISDEYKYPFA